MVIVFSVSYKLRNKQVSEDFMFCETIAEN